MNNNWMPSIINHEKCSEITNERSKKACLIKHLKNSQDQIAFYINGHIPITTGKLIGYCDIIS